MASWPKVDPEVRRRGFAKLREAQAIRESRLTPGERIAQADRLREFARMFDGGRPPSAAGSDEPAELMLRLGGRVPRAPG